jgi:hypothetical protein
MRNLMSLFLATSIGCTSGLWGPFAEDTAASCLVTPCQSGTCNQSTGLCEGGVSDMGASGDMGGGTTDVFGPVDTISALGNVSSSSYALAIADLVGDSAPDIVIADGTNTLNVGYVQLSNFNKTSIKLELGQSPIYLASYQSSASLDALVATDSGRIYYLNKKGVAAPGYAETNLGTGYKIISVGYIDYNDTQDFTVTGSKLTLIKDLYAANGNTGINVGSGNAVAALNVSSGIPSFNYTDSSGNLSALTPSQTLMNNACLSG